MESSLPAAAGAPLPLHSSVVGQELQQEPPKEEFECPTTFTIHTLESKERTKGDTNNSNTNIQITPTSPQQHTAPRTETKALTTTPTTTSSPPQTSPSTPSPSSTSSSYRLRDYSRRRKERSQSHTHKRILKLAFKRAAAKGQTQTLTPTRSIKRAVRQSKAQVGTCITCPCQRQGQRLGQSQIIPIQGQIQGKKTASPLQEAASSGDNQYTGSASFICICTCTTASSSTSSLSTDTDSQNSNIGPLHQLVNDNDNDNDINSNNTMAPVFGNHNTKSSNGEDKSKRRESTGTDTTTASDDFSYANLKNMWSKRDIRQPPLSIKPATARTPMRLSARSPPRERLTPNGNETSRSRSRSGNNRQRNEQQSHRESGNATYSNSRSQHSHRGQRQQQQQQYQRSPSSHGSRSKSNSSPSPVPRSSKYEQYSSTNNVNTSYHSNNSSNISHNGRRSHPMGVTRAVNMKMGMGMQSKSSSNRSINSASTSHSRLSKSRSNSRSNSRPTSRSKSRSKSRTKSREEAEVGMILQSTSATKSHLAHFVQEVHQQYNNSTSLDKNIASPSPNSSRDVSMSRDNIIHSTPSKSKSNRRSTNASRNNHSMEQSPNSMSLSSALLSPISTGSSRTQESRYDKDITANLMKTNANNYSSEIDTDMDTDNDVDTSGEGQQRVEHLPKPTRLWQSDSSWEPSSSPASLSTSLEEEDGIAKADRNVNVSGKKNSNSTGEKMEDNDPGVDAEEEEDEFPSSHEWEDVDVKVKGKVTSNSNATKQQQQRPPPTSWSRQPTFRQSARNNNNDKNSNNQVFDPYDNFESMSSINSEATARIENKSASMLLHALQQRNTKNKVAAATSAVTVASRDRKMISNVFDTQYEADSNIPDSAFGIQVNAASLARNVMGKKTIDAGASVDMGVGNSKLDGDGSVRSRSRSLPFPSPATKSPLSSSTLSHKSMSMPSSISTSASATTSRSLGEEIRKVRKERVSNDHKSAKTKTTSKINMTIPMNMDASSNIPDSAFGISATDLARKVIQKDIARVGASTAERNRSRSRSRSKSVSSPVQSSASSRNKAAVPQEMQNANKNTNTIPAEISKRAVSQPRLPRPVPEEKERPPLSLPSQEEPSMSLRNFDTIGGSYDSLFQNVPRFPQHAKSIAESDVFDGLSDIGSSHVPSFGMNFFQEDSNCTTADNITTPICSSFSNRSDDSKQHSHSDPRKRSNSKAGNGRGESNKSSGWPSSPQNNDLWSFERSKQAKKKFTDNLAAFAKKNPLSKSRSRSKPSDGKMRLSIPNPKPSRRRPMSSPSPRSAFKALDSVGEEDGQAPALTNQSEDDMSDTQSEVSGTESAISVGIAPVELGPKGQSMMQKFSEHFDFLSSPDYSDKNRPAAASKTIAPVDKDSMNYLDLEPEPNLPEDDDDDNDNVENTGENSIESKVKYSYPTFPKEEPTYAVANVRWIPSMLRLYEKKVAAEKSSKAPACHQSPNSVVDTSIRDGLSASDCRLNGNHTILLYYNQSFGGKVETPSKLVTGAPLDTDKLIKRKLRRHIDGTNNRNGPKRIISREENKDIFDKAVEFHESALTLLENGKIEDAIESYEAFFEMYAKREMIVIEPKQEKEIITSFLYNMGMVYLLVEDFDFSIEFFNEAIETLYLDDGSKDGEIAAITNQIGIAKFGKCNFEEALKDFADTLSLWQDLDNNVGMIRSLNNIGSTYFALGEMDAAIEAFEEALELQRSFLLDYFGHQTKKNNNNDIHSAFTALSRTLCNMAYLYKSSDSPSKPSMTPQYFLEESVSIQKQLEGKCGYVIDTNITKILSNFT